MDIELKEKISLTPNFLNELISKGWLEIDYLQTQLRNVDNNTALKQLLNNLLTSYYVFVGGLENIQLEGIANMDNKNTCTDTALKQIDIIEQDKIDNSAEIALNKIQQEVPSTTVTSMVDEPFEYFVDFDEPIGNPISDKDLYGQ